ncbi:MAG: RsmD family RNA methyltransferase [Prevotella sp.]|jgi:16S rRNA (guanine(966)-N(2))-methyltransferase RsmD|uniref:RsmD family RNA methyltransferase n=1 Tax=Segatella cerevisiae TaxID=2053716 RepID=A0ABT1BT93_9BACT|nr:RsmD family RNA methyltransferase [Segatella cerevisiae]MCH3993988.1 RsmD family RNA methyltransferase [Prevotella sp.]MCI1246958.1 RsmD family RNA methyltransferase [Prevotella sp.]MCO6024300.1 RsmD family RNA methyltransferase [Segatella cerevisiae]
MRIITGIYKGRRFDIPRTFSARPTTDMAKENIFNVIRGYLELDGTTALDLFSGTGSISLELASRGCQKIISVEGKREHAKFIAQCFEKIGCDKDILICGDVFRFIKRNRQTFDFIFADPPYMLPELTTIPDLIFENKMLSENGIFILEHGAKQDFSEHPHFIEHRNYGAVNFSIFK